MYIELILVVCVILKYILDTILWCFKIIKIVIMHILNAFTISGYVADPLSPRYKKLNN